MLLQLVESTGACGGSLGMWLCMAAQKGPFVSEYYVVLSPIAPRHLSLLLQKGEQKKTELWMRGRRLKEREEKTERDTWTDAKKAAMRWQWWKVRRSGTENKQCSSLCSFKVFSQIYCQTENPPEYRTSSTFAPLRWHLVHSDRMCNLSKAGSDQPKPISN